MVRQMVFCVSLLMAVNCLGQTTNKARQGYEQFKKQARQGYVDFRRACNADYAAFLKQAWQSYEAGPVVPRPKEREVKPVVMPQGGETYAYQGGYGDSSCASRGSAQACGSHL